MTETKPVGGLTLPEVRALEDIQARMDATLRRIGELEVERQRLVDAVRSIEGESARVLSTIADRLNIPEGSEWAVDRDGTVRVVTP